MKVWEIMSQPPIMAHEETPLEEVARTMLDHEIGGLPVVNDQGMLRGIITESDFAAKEKGFPFSTFRAPQVLGHWVSEEGVEQIYEAARRMKAKEIMTTRVVTLAEDDSINKAVELMLRHNINRIPVVRDGVVVGIVARHDLLRLLIPERK
jgi:CBS domain-containing protein